MSEIGDIVAIAALIASSLIFWIGYSRTRKSEQIKIAREHMDRLEAKYNDFENKYTDLEIKFGKSSEDISPATAAGAQQPSNAARLDEYVGQIDDITREIDYFDLLVTNHEVLDKNVLSYYAPRIRKELGNLISKLNKIEEMKKEGNKWGVPQKTFDNVIRMNKNLNDKERTWKKRTKVGSKAE